MYPDFSVEPPTPPGLFDKMTLVLMTVFLLVVVTFIFCG